MFNDLFEYLIYDVYPFNSMSIGAIKEKRGKKDATNPFAMDENEFKRGFLLTVYADYF